MTFAVKNPPGAAYQRAVEGARACYEKSFEVTADWFPESKSGRVSAALRTPFALSTLVVIDISPAPVGATINVVAHRSTHSMIRNVNQWLDGHFDHCDP